MNQDRKNTKDSSEKHVQQKRGPELGEKMKESQKKGEEYRAEHQGKDAMKSPGTSSTEKTHKS